MIKSGEAGGKAAIELPVSRRIGVCNLRVEGGSGVILVEDGTDLCFEVPPGF